MRLQRRTKNENRKTQNVKGESGSAVCLLAAFPFCVLQFSFFIFRCNSTSGASLSRDSRRRGGELGELGLVVVGGVEEFGRLLRADEGAGGQQVDALDDAAQAFRRRLHLFFAFGREGALGVILAVALPLVGVGGLAVADQE